MNYLAKPNQHIFAGLVMGLMGVFLYSCKGSKATENKLSQSSSVSIKEIWKIGENDSSGGDLALGPADYKKFLSRDFGFEDRYFLIGTSQASSDFPYVLPGPDDTWGGTWGTSGWRTHEINILFDLDEVSKTQGYNLIVDLADSNPRKALVKVSVNDQSEKFLINGVSDSSIVSNPGKEAERLLSIPLKAETLQKGGNLVNITVLEGSWIVFDQVKLEGPSTTIIRKAKDAFVRSAKAAPYEIGKEGRNYQPLLVDIEHLSGLPKLEVLLDGKTILTETLEDGRYDFEAPMPAVTSHKTSKYEVKVDGVTVRTGIVNRDAKPLQTPADYVNTLIGTAHSRWMIAPGPWMPFSMVKLSPDNQNMGWQAGYQPSFETIGTFSHIHEWTMAGLGMMPTNGILQTKVGEQFQPDSGYRSRMDKSSEEAPLGHYKVHLTDTDIWADVTATTHGGFHKYDFPKGKNGRVMIDLHVQAEYDYKLLDVKVNKVSDYRIEGSSHQISPRPTVWSNDADQEYTVNFVIEFDQPIAKVGVWENDEVSEAISLKAKDLKDAGMYVEFDTETTQTVQARSAISLVSIDNASDNLETEISKPFGWDFDAVVSHNKSTWNEYFNRIAIRSDNRLEKERFYSNFYRSLCRNTWSDVNGEWVAADETVQKFEDPDQVALGCDAFWNTFWNLNQFWNLVTPEWSSRWVNSQLAMFDVNGWLAKGPAGMEYIPVMVAEHEIPLIVSAYQMGIDDFDTEKALEAMVKMQTTHAGPVAGGFAGNRDLTAYMKYHYVPYDIGRFSNSLEYSFDDWSVGQFAKSLGQTDTYKKFSERGTWWKNAFSKDGFAQLRDSKGEFMTPFDPFQSGRNEEYVEGNSWQLSYFVPQDVPTLTQIMGEDKFVERLNWGFEASESWRYNAPNDQYWDYPVVQGNQQSMHFAFLFNWANHPWLTQKWSRSIIEKYYGYGVANAYLGDEDQGQMSAWFVMSALGLFQTDGGARAEPIYEIASPLFEKTVIDLGERYGRGKQFTIEAKNVSKTNKYVQSAQLNGKRLETFYFPAAELLKGGELILNMGPEPNKNWGLLKTK
tara:strand:- start:2814 stop:6011 length:3198 start_codon:yes stop_codon:yes gene_type:complete